MRLRARLNRNDIRQIVGEDARLIREFEKLLTEDDFTTQRSAPSASGFNVQITDGSNDIHLILKPAGAYAAGTITLPAVANAVDKQEVLVNCTQSVTALTVSGNGAAVVGAPTTLAANDYFLLKYDFTDLTWYRVG